nr:nonstructural protein 1 NS1 [Chaphamaparvovirus anseriform 9]
MSREIQRARKSVRRFLWRGIRGQSIHECMGSGREAAPEILEEKEYVLRPMPVIEVEQKHMNMRAYIGGVLMVTDGDGNVIENPVIYANLLNNMTCNDEWICIGEKNKDEIFHVHTIARTGVRTDSYRRTALSVWKTIQNATAILDEYGACTLDMVKCQKAHKVTALLEYMCKCPEWICSTSDRLLQLTYDIIEWDMCSRFRGEPEPQPNIDKANPMIQEILQCIMENGCKSVEDVMKRGSDLVVKHLHRPGISTIIQNCITYARCTGQQWNLRQFAGFQPDPGLIHGCLLTQGIAPSDFDYNFWQWITKKHTKRNTIHVLGASNTGKSSFIAGLGKVCPGGEVVNGVSFNFEGLIEMYWGKWEEPLCAPEIVEKFKQISEGMQCAIPVKFKKPYMLPRTPIYITTNAPIWTWCQNAKGPLLNRMWCYEFNYDMSDGVFNPRCSESSCKCRYCELSRGGKDPASISTISRVQSSKQSISECMDAGLGNSKSTMGSGSMSERTGSSGSTSTTSSSSRESSSNTTARGSTSSTISNISGSDSKHGSSNTDERVHTSTGSTECMVSIRTKRNNGDDSTRSGRCRDRRHGSRRDSKQDAILQTMVSMGTTGDTQSKMEIPTKKSKMDKSVVTLTVPDKPDWQGYLAYLYRKYEEPTSGKPDLTAYESLDSDSE